MRAADHARHLLVSGVPDPGAYRPEAWDSAPALRQVDEDLRLFWDSRVPGSGARECLMAAALQSAENKGCALPPYEALLDEGLRAVAQGDMATLATITFRLRALLRAAPAPRRPTDWDSVAAQVAWPPDAPLAPGSPDLAARIEAAWQGQLVGAACGTALEGFSASAIAAAFGRIDRYVRPPDTLNDDITYQLAFLDAFVARGPAVSSTDIAERWVALIPSGWSAEAVALDNLRRGILPPDSATTDNPFDEWIGAQMRGAICGMVVPGRVREAARLAWIDARISHAGSGILGEMFNAALLAGAFAAHDARSLLDDTIRLFGSKTDYAQALQFARTACAEAPDWQAAWARCDGRYADYNWIHVLPNAAAQVIALWFGDGDFDATLAVACGIGHDADCNAAQVLAAIGALHGPDAIPTRWTQPLGDTIRTTMRHLAELPFRTLVEQTVRAARSFRLTSSATSLV
jgi:ADP-ribosylglycohydrolase